jgi:hypothetical protein
MLLFFISRFRIEDTSVRTICELAQFPDHICTSDGSFHTTTGHQHDTEGNLMKPLILEPSELFPFGSSGLCDNDSSNNSDDGLVTWQEVNTDSQFLYLHMLLFFFFF